MFNCYDTILQQQQRRSQESNKVLTRRCICEEYLNVTSLKKRGRSVRREDAVLRHAGLLQRSVTQELLLLYI